MCLSQQRFIFAFLSNSNEKSVKMRLNKMCIEHTHIYIYMREKERGFGTTTGELVYIPEKHQIMNTVCYLKFHAVCTITRW